MDVWLSAKCLLKTLCLGVLWIPENKKTPPSFRRLGGWFDTKLLWLHNHRVLVFFTSGVSFRLFLRMRQTEEEKCTTNTCAAFCLTWIMVCMHATLGSISKVCMYAQHFVQPCSSADSRQQWDFFFHTISVWIHPVVFIFSLNASQLDVVMVPIAQATIQE